ncbi:TetR/AcrR family transcriptional regulator [Agarivorans sp. 1_MG-2023]|uniref:TetR/AcrR family transcriptional regulator n=1 Tax=Agarivorans sp. 1_MG-2023 TaxID=3062634 RepID=UPI0026E3056F|nr:TetR/AcrR family transcriptional regulator [Agarivorans sp. 1_MG-2023]MDO6763081.1 TetR/AcrR family transcriptional regulator [Agarivorans sp. 1_MG-2023]
MIEQQIAANLENAFSELGFTEPSVATLQKASGVSLRTLYRYFPSKESMVIAALEHRHVRYLELLAAEPTKQAVFAAFEQLELWMVNEAPTGCMSMSALAAYPENPQINAAVKQHKQALLALFVRFCASEQLGLQVFLLHEGVSSAWPTIGDDCIQSAQLTLQLLLGE